MATATSWVSDPSRWHFSLGALTIHLGLSLFSVVAALKYHKAGLELSAPCELRTHGSGYLPPASYKQASGQNILPATPVLTAPCIPTKVYTWLLVDPLRLGSGGQWACP